MSIEEFLRDKIVGSGVSVYQLSKLSGVHESTIHAFVGKRRRMTLDTLQKLCNTLNLKIVETSKPEIEKLRVGRKKEVKE